MNKWAAIVLKQMDEKLQPEESRKILEACGENCPFTHLKDDRLLELRSQVEDDIAFLDLLCEKWRLKKENETWYAVFDQCYCPLVDEKTPDMSPTLCYCTIGNLKHKFEIGLTSPVKIIKEKTILGGDDECRFRIDLLDQK